MQKHRRFPQIVQSSIKLLLVSTVLLCASTSSSFALDLKPSEIRGDQRKNPVSVLQNRYFLKAWRPEIGFTAGSFLNESYTDTTSMGVRGALFFNEWLGLEIQHSTTSVKDSDDRKALNKLEYKRIDDDKIVSPDPEINPIHKITEVNVIYAPFYGKLNLMDALIVYSDMYLTGGVAQINTDQGDLSALVIGGGQRFYWTQSMAFRIDFRDRIFNEKRAGQDNRKNSYAFDVGMSYFFL